MPRRTGAAIALIAVASVWGACAEQRVEPLQSVLEPMVWRAHPQGGLELRGKAERMLRSVDDRREGGAMVLAELDGRKLALIADEDATALRVVDPATHKQLGLARLRGRPSQVVVGADGRAYVALRDHQRVVALEVAPEPSAKDDAADDSQPGAAAKAAGNRGRNAKSGNATAANSITLKETGDFPTASEPVGLAMSPDGDTLLVVSGWGRQLQAFSLLQGHKRFSLRVPREPRGVTTSADGKLAFISHAVGSSITRVELDGKAHEKTALMVGGADHQVITVRTTCGLGDPLCFFKGDNDGGGSARHAVQGFALAAYKGEVIAPLVLVHPGDRAVGGYGTSAGFPAHQPTLAIAYNDNDEVMLRVDNRRFAASLKRTGDAGTQGSGGCFLPRAVALDTQRELALVSCLGNNQMVAYQLAPKSLVRSTLARWKLPAGPVGIAVDSQAGRAYVWSQYASKLSTVTLPGMPDEQKPSKTFATLPHPGSIDRSSKLPEVSRVEGAPAALSNAAKHGRELFHAAGDPRISGDGRACASCHPDGREDGLSWPTPQGRSQTPMLAGRMGPDTAPYGWNGESDSVAKHVTHTFRRLGGRGLKGPELAALMAFIQEMPPPPQPHALVSDTTEVAHNDSQIKRGKELFESDMVGCAVCHKNGDGSDGAVHDVGSGRTLDTPSLRYIGGTGPYFHDGRYATLMELLRETKGKMGWGADLDDDDLQALNAYLLTL